LAGGDTHGSWTPRRSASVSGSKLQPVSDLAITTMRPSYPIFILLDVSKTSRFCCKKSGRNPMDIPSRLLFRLGCHSKQAGNECDLTGDGPLFHASHLPFPDHVHHLVALQG